MKVYNVTLLPVKKENFILKMFIYKYYLGVILPINFLVLFIT